MSYFSKLESLFLDMLKLDLSEEVEESFEIALNLLDQEEKLVNSKFENDDNLKKRFGFIEPETCLVLNEIDSSIDSFSQDESIGETEVTDFEDEEKEIGNNQFGNQDYQFIDGQDEYGLPKFRNQAYMNNQDVSQGIGTKQEPGTGPSGTKRPRPDPVRDFYPQTNEFRINNSPFGSNVLNLECESMKERRIRIDLWSKEMSLIISTNPSVYDGQQNVLLLIDHKTTGTVNKFIKDTSWTPRIDAEDAFNDIINFIYLEFLGIDYVGSKAAEKDKERQESINILHNMQLCNICELKPFFCVFEKHMINTGEQTNYPMYIEMFIRKIPVVGETVMQRHKALVTENTKFSLAFAYNLVTEEVAKHCEFIKTTKKLKAFSKKCCDKTQKPSYTFGCSPEKTRKHKRYKKKFRNKKVSKYRFKKKKKSFKPGKYLRNKKDHQNDKQKYCPKKKKNCRCWICNEEGHYANECPNRKEHDSKVKVLEQILQMEYIPVEDYYDGLDQVYVLEKAETSSEEERTSESESSSTEDESD
ncbi:coat protein [Angelica bushy stunt virus]|uniref:Coat protein n=1 Tax=Angelica bushy stunt virus TaxID=1808970 RepID=A0A140GL61_9VIRU|nr:coat protein [Angelica bushy stunt virus]AMN10079.1 coat protein [Angelica bushy stunt virus]